MFGLFSDTPVRIQIPLTSSEALDRLGTELRGGGMKGIVATDQIVLSLAGIVPNRAYQPTFQGVVAPESGGSTLSGIIRYPSSLKLFSRFFLGFSIFWTVMAFIRTQGDKEIAWLPLAGIAFFVFGVGFFKVLNAFASRLAGGLEAEIRRALARVA